jgi:hypothetical protein
LNFHTHAARLIRACSQAYGTSTTSPISQSGDVTAAAIAGVTLRCDEIVIQIQGCLSHRALAADTNGGCRQLSYGAPACPPSNKWPEVTGFVQGLSLHAAVLQSPDGAP